MTIIYIYTLVAVSELGPSLYTEVNPILNLNQLSNTIVSTNDHDSGRNSPTL